MAFGSPLCVFKPVLIVAALAAVGMGGYNLATKGCPWAPATGARRLLPPATPRATPPQASAQSPAAA
ncbi:MAG: hypothetical protein IPJ41_13190 [Phycisphaerales bacterium]|nr:hypothetical protein [Phycisphaerales bacterium]